jgi:chloramphenicol 3-O-phosphotransferase
VSGQLVILNGAGQGCGCIFGIASLVGTAFRQAEATWMVDVATTGRAAIGVLMDDVFLSRALLRGPGERRWTICRCPVGVHCELAEAERREQARPDRTAGMRRQAGLVHRSVFYGAEVDTGRESPGVLARHLRRVLDLAAHP